MNGSAPERLAVGEVIVPSFERLVSSIYSAVMYNLGELKLRGIPEVPTDVSLARFNLGLLQILQEKCRGNLTDEESRFLATMIESAEKAIAAHLSDESEESDAARS